jgi:peptidoglycan/LPS O-acetylase OafA/YrhL
VWHRYIRLLRPYVVVLLLAIVFAALSRQMISHEDTPAAPGFLQVLVHILLMHDIIHVNALSAGVWYVAIDFQLYLVFVLMLWGSQKLAQHCRIDMRTMALLLVLGLSAASLLWFNRDPAMDEWAFYFFGAYSLGIMVQWSDGFTRKHPWLAILLGVVVVALALEWRSRLAIAVSTALILGVGLHLKPLLFQGIHSLFGWLGRISYSVFLIHYPVVLIVGSVVASVWPGDATMSAVGLLGAWGLALWGGSMLYRYVERGGATRR